MKKIQFSISMIVVMLSVGMMNAQGPDNWFNKDFGMDGVQGVSTDKAYDLLKGKTSTPVIVAIIDSGVDLEHEDLSEIIWTNQDEIAGNGKDDDNNGYVDDVHGWNFLGGANGENVNEENLEITRLYRHYSKKFGDAKESMLNKSQKKEYARYMKIKEAFESKREELEGTVERVEAYFSALRDGMKMLADNELEPTEENISNMPESTDEEKELKSKMMNAVNRDMDFSNLDEIEKGALDYYNGSLNYHYNADFDPRPIIGDDYSNLYEIGYGNADAEGPDAGHGTHVSGIVGAIRGNNVGMDGVADNVKIMSVRAVPDGDEHDKDVANAIRYAVDNGAKIINMSFGKGYSWNKQVVDEAVQYAVKNDVLLVHAAGNSAQDNDSTNNFPNDVYEKGGLFKKKAKTWIEVGALSWKEGEDMVAGFSNYGKKQVDIFAPGYQIYSTVPQSEYATFSGTSMASPTVAGVAALVWSYFPDLSAKKLKKILLKSAVKMETDVKVPGMDGQKKPFSDLSTTGGVVNAYNAIKMAM
jgi:subtilisin family serine protease